jgi:4-hydroxybenzoate polyprenyltransferase
MAGLATKDRPFWIFIWAFAFICLSISAFLVNFISENRNSDGNKWNLLDHQTNQDYNGKVVLALFVLFSIAGLLISFLLGLIWWAIAIYAVGVLYFLKPIHLKNRFALDLITQLSVWGILPFLAPLQSSGNISKAPDLVIPLSLIALSAILPHKLSQIESDSKEKLENTHTVLGMEKSLRLGLILSAVGALSFFGSRIFIYFIWSWPFLLLAIYSLKKYRDWLELFESKPKSLSLEITNYKNRLKLVSLPLVPYLFLHFLFS